MQFAFAFFYYLMGVPSNMSVPRVFDDMDTDHSGYVYCIQLLFEVLKNSLYSPAGGYLCYFRFAHSSTQTKQIQSRVFI